MGLTFSTDGKDEQKLVTRVIEYDRPATSLSGFAPKQSQALIAIAPTLYERTIRPGAGAHLGEEFLDALAGESKPESEEGKGFMPRENVEVCQGEKTTLLEAIANQAKKTGKDGLFFLYMAAAAVTVPTSELEDKVCLALDFKHDQATTIDTDELSRALQETRAKHVVIILECSGSARAFSAQLVAAKAMEKCLARISLVLVLAKGESAIFYDEIGCGVFTYFFLRVLKHHIGPGRLDLNQVVAECTALLAAADSLVYDGTAPGQLPSPRKAVDFSDLQAAIKQLKHFRAPARQGSGTDTPDTGSAASRLGFIYCHMRWPIVPCKELEEWLESTVLPNLQTLAKHITRERSDIINAIIATLARSCAFIVVSHQPSVVDDRNLFLLCLVRVAEALAQFTEWDLLDILDSRHVHLALGYYIHFISVAKGKAFNKAEAEKQFPSLFKLHAELGSLEEINPGMSSDERKTDQPDGRCRPSLLPRGCFPV